MDFIVNVQLKFLVQLQEKDSQISEIIEKQKNLPNIIASLKVNLDKAQKDFAEEAQDYDNSAKERRSLEGLLQDAESKVKKLKERIPEIKTNKEYQALLKEVSAAEQEKSDIEEKILILLEKMDDLKDRRAEKGKIVKEEETSFTKEKEKIEKDFNQLSEILRELESQKTHLLPQMDSKLLAEYNRLISRRKGVAVVRVQNEHCLGCHMRLPPQVFTEIKKNEKIIYCLNCKRILYWKPQNIVS
ncbi:MAG: hypothetical protein HZA09_06050 [Nitrospirae bacterium]|nr:hypothetical protein [Nitrospirota bacterium]